MYGLSYSSNTNYTTYWGGTSQAAPLVTGVAAIMKSIAPNLSVDSVRLLLRNHAVDQVGKVSEDTPGWDQYHGAGLLNAFNTLQFLSFITGVEDIHFKKSIKIYPNPTFGNIRLDMEEIQENIEIEIRNLLGQVIERKSFINVNQVNFEIKDSKGMYFITIRKNHRQKAVLKVLKE